MASVPQSPCLRSWSSRFVMAAMSKSWAARAASSSPASVSSMWCGPRRKSWSPISSSSIFIWLLSGGWAMCNRLAAAVICRSSTIAMK